MKGAGRSVMRDFGELRLPVHSLNTLVIGSGAAARNAALQLFRRGVDDIAIVTDKWNAGTSYNAGSDKQTYYKLALTGNPDSAGELAHDLWCGGCMHGDVALCEAQGSPEAFFNLVDLGVPFPHDRFGGFLGYRTDNDRKGRATSAGPLTSKLMCECLGKELDRWGLRVFDGHQVVALLTCPDAPAAVDPEAPPEPIPRGMEGVASSTAVCGAIAIAKDRLNEEDFGLVIFNARNVILATGGPGGMYRDSVYPQSQRGSTGLALRAGAVAQNLTESQFGIASVGFRWNLSGSYQQVVPRYISTDPDGTDEREFLNTHFPDVGTLASAIFRKGYEWPFDCEKVAGYGSSLIDLLVYREAKSGRRVFLDFTKNSDGGDGMEPFSLDSLDDEARDYLQRSGALGGIPIQRLMALNQPAITLFRDHGIDLATDRLEIAVCAQHNNGGLRADLWWQSNLKHLFPVGEVCGTHGVRRPGGAALNAGQVGGVRAAQFIAANYQRAPLDMDEFVVRVGTQVADSLSFCAATLDGARGEESLTPAEVIGEVQERMSRSAAHVRDPYTVDREVKEAKRLVQRLPKVLRTRDARAVTTAFWAADLCLTHLVYLEAIQAYLEAGGRSRGSVLVLDGAGELPFPTLEEGWRFGVNEADAPVDREILEVWVKSGGEVATRWVPVRPIPSAEGWFEEVWTKYREGRIVR
jgi:succinate dehydrogenase/fumarate reductase flavoprotein subunit